MLAGGANDAVGAGYDLSCGNESHAVRALPCRHRSPPNHQLNLILTYSPQPYPKPFAMIISLCILDRRKLNAVAERVNTLRSYLDAVAEMECRLRAFATRPA